MMSGQYGEHWITLAVILVQDNARPNSAAATVDSNFNFSHTPRYNIRCLDQQEKPCMDVYLPVTMSLTFTNLASYI